MMPLHRLRQGLRALFAFTRRVDLALAAEYLTPEQLILFQRMRRVEQLHSLNVLRSVLAQGAAPPDLAVAALLHDVGKACYPLALWQKVLTVLVHAFAPATFLRLSSGDPRQPFQRPFVVYAKHPFWSAELLEAAGATPGALWLVKHHADDSAHLRNPDLAPLLQRLRSADDAN